MAYVKVGIHETGEIFDSRKTLADELGLLECTLQYYLYKNKKWNGLTFYTIWPDKTKCHKCDKTLTEKNWPVYLRKRCDYICTDCRYEQSKKHKRNPMRVKAVSFRNCYNCSITFSEIEYIWDEQKGHCGICKDKLNKTSFHLDHIVPFSRDGGSVISNLQILCEKCNRGKFNWSQEEYIEHCKKVAKNN